MSSVEMNARNRTPRWAGILVVVVLLGSLAAGVAMYFLMPTQPKLSELTEVPAAGQPLLRLTNRGTLRPAQAASGINEPQAGVYRIRVPGAVANVRTNPNQKRLVANFSYNNKPDLVPAELQPALMARNQLPTDQNFVKRLNVTPQQLEELKKIPMVASFAAPTMVVKNEDRDRVISLVEAWVKDKTAANEQAVTKAVQEIATQSEAPTKADIADRVEKIKKILTPEQLAAFKL